MEFVNKTQVVFEPDAVSGIDLGTTGEQYRTPTIWREQLGDLARLSYLRALLVVELTASAASNAVVTLSLETATGSVWSQDFTFAGTSVSATVEPDLSTVKGSAPLALVVTVGTADAGKTAQLRAKMTLEHPLVISNC